MAATAKHDVVLAGQGYILLEESYRQQAQAPFTPRFATGDPGYGDLSFWQFLNQEDFSAGEGQEIFSDHAKYKQSAGWDLRGGKPALAFGPAVVAPTAAPPAFASAGPSNTVFDNFSDGDYTNNPTWTITSKGGSIGVSAGVFQVNNYWAHAAQTLGEGSFSVDAKFSDYLGGTNVGDAVVLLAIASTEDAAGYGFFSLDGNTYFGKSNGGIRISSATWTILVSLGVTETAVKTYRMDRDALGNFSIYKQGVLIGTATDTTYNSFTHIHVWNGSGASGSPTTWVDSITIPATSSNTFSTKAIHYNNQIYFCYPTAAAAFTVTTVLTGSTVTNQPTMKHIAAEDIGLISRDGNISNKNVFLYAIHGTTMKVYDGASEVASISLTAYGKTVQQINSVTLLVAGSTTNYGGIPIFERIIFGAGAWSTTQVVITADGGVSGTIGGHSAQDADGTMYFVATDFAGSLGQSPTRVFALTSADALATLPTISQISDVPFFAGRGCFALGGVIYLFGASYDGNVASEAIIKLDRTSVYKSTANLSLSSASPAQLYNFGIYTVVPLLGSVLFLSRNDLALWNPVLELASSGAVREVASFAAGINDYSQPNPISICEYSGHYYLIQPVAQVVQRSGNTRGSFPATFSSLRLELSSFGGNTQLINKTLFAVTLELSEAVPSGETIYVDINGTQVVAMVNADGTSKETILSSELTSGRFKPVIRTAYNSTWQGKVERVTLRYVPTQFKKRAWSFGVRADRNLKLADNTRETTSPIGIFAAVISAWSSNVPVTFVDVDGSSYSVIVTDFKQLRPLINKDRNKAESLLFVELLQV